VADYLLIQAVDAAFVPYLALSYAPHAAYAARCGADYVVYTGRKDPGLHPSWNRIPLLLDGLWQGYRKLAWVDADCLVVAPEVNLFTATADAVPLQMCRYADVQWRGQDHFNAGVLVVNSGDAALTALSYVWARRGEHAPHHYETFWEQNWLLDYAYDHPWAVSELPHRFNWIPTKGDPAQTPVILGFHGFGAEQFPRFQAAVAQYYGAS
jgi:hypothetical protein